MFLSFSEAQVYHLNSTYDTPSICGKNHTNT